MTQLSNVDRDFLYWGLQEGIRDIVLYHNNLHNILGKTYKESSNNISRNMLLGYSDRNTTQSFLLLLFYTEEILFIAWKTRAKDLHLEQKTNFLEKYKPMLVHLGVDLSSLSCWAFLSDAYEIRNCLIHANGDITRMKDKTKINNCLARHEDKIAVNRNKIVISKEYLSDCANAIHDLVHQVA